jgi:hypothetical protein
VRTTRLERSRFELVERGRFQLLECRRLQSKLGDPFVAE